MKGEKMFLPVLSLYASAGAQMGEKMKKNAGQMRGMNTKQRLESGAPRFRRRTGKTVFFENPAVTGTGGWFPRPCG